MTDGSANDRDADKSEKSETAFRTISEVAQDLDLPQHVLRFWETKFPQVRPMKRGGGRRYYRPDDMLLLRRIRTLLYVDGYTIKGVQKLLRQSGSVRNFVADTEAIVSKTNAAQVDTMAQDPQLSPDASTDADIQTALHEIIADLKGLQAQLLQSAS